MKTDFLTNPFFQKQQSPKFDYWQAFDRNIGWLTVEEQNCLRNSCVAVAGLGGAGGFQIQALARLGVGKFKIADPDTFELTNVNRQVGATAATLGRPKVEVIREMILSINADAQIECFPQGINEDNVERFLSGAGLAVDGIDYFAQKAKDLLFAKCKERKLTALTCCPLGFGATVLIFSPQGMSYEDYFDLREGMDEEEKRRAMTFGLSPSPLCLSYMNPSALRTGEKKRSASVSPGLMLVGALTASEAVKVLTGKGRVLYCPHVFQIDLLTHGISRKYYPQGMRGPIMRLKKWLLFQWMKRSALKAATVQAAVPIIFFCLSIL